MESDKGMKILTLKFKLITSRIEKLLKWLVR